MSRRRFRLAFGVAVPILMIASIVLVKTVEVRNSREGGLAERVAPSDPPEGRDRSSQVELTLSEGERDRSPARGVLAPQEPEIEIPTPPIPDSPQGSRSRYLDMNYQEASAEMRRLQRELERLDVKVQEHFRAQAYVELAPGEPAPKDSAVLRVSVRTRRTDGQRSFAILHKADAPEYFETIESIDALAQNPYLQAEMQQLFEKRARAVDSVVERHNAR